VQKRGAEAVITAMEWRGRPAVEKRRVTKGYRDPALDEELRRSRLRKEVRLFREARRAGVPVPVIYDIDPAGHTLVMQRIEAPTVKERLREPGDRSVIVDAIGRTVGQLHAAGVVHGDLTTSNMLWSDDRLYLIDLSLGEKTDSTEARGVDLRLLKEACTSAHYDRPELFDVILAGYRAAFRDADTAIEKMREIEERGRYT
jgi:Kae1-associated kinase Bud32